MRNNTHIVLPDEEGFFYCRAVDAVLNICNDEQLCGQGCPCFMKINPLNNGAALSDGCADYDTGICKSLGFADVSYDMDANIASSMLYKGRLYKRIENRFVCSYCDETGGDISVPLFPRVKGLDGRLARAYAYSARAHYGQPRKGTKIPYFSHIITTLNYAMELTDDVEILIAAILHDTVEDTPVTLEDIKNEFGARVARLVEFETEDKLHDMPADKTWEIRKKKTLEHLGYLERDAKIIALSDKTANAESMVREWRRIGDRIWKKFNQTDKKMQEWYYRGCADALGEFNDTIVMKIFRVYMDELFAE